MPNLIKKSWMDSTAQESFLGHALLILTLVFKNVPLHGGAFCQSSFQWIYYYGSNKSTGKEIGKSHLCALRALRFFREKGMVT
jgi:hypothetical protein